MNYHLEMRFKTHLLIFGFICLLLTACQANQPAVNYERVAVTGASVTCGFGVSTRPIPGDLGAYPVTMREIFDAMIETPNHQVAFFGDKMFFSRPDSMGKELIVKINEYKPTLVIGIDYLFWFAYGMFSDNTEEARLKRLEEGFNLLASIDAQIIVGDIPNMSQAIGGLLSSSQVPSVATIAKMNLLIEQRAIDYPNLTVVPLYEIVEKLKADERIEVMDVFWPAGSQKLLLQQDKLHPTLEGTVAICLFIAEVLGEEDFLDNPKRIMLQAEQLARENESKGN